MDQIKIGQFIASERKKKGYTQKQLAEKLDISDKTISKWERGNGFPEVSLLLPLCDEIGITVNELLTGERVSENDYQKFAEENMVNMIKEREANQKRFALTVVTGIISIVSFLTLLCVVAAYTDVITLPVKVIIITIACCIFGVGIFIAMEGERKIGYFKCNKCGKAFVPDFLAYSMGMHFITKRYLKCPHCEKRSWCIKIMSKDEEE